MIVRMLVDGKSACRLSSEQPHVLGMLGNCFRHAGATHVPIETYDPIALRHYHMQIVTDEQHAETTRGSEAAYKAVEFCLSGVVDAAHGFIEHKQRWVTQERARQHHALKLTAGKRGELLAGDTPRSDLIEYCRHVGAPTGQAKCQEALDGYGDGWITIEPLRRIADPEIRSFADVTTVCWFQTEQHAHQRRLSGTVRTDQGHDLAGAYVDVDIFENRPPRSSDEDAARRKEGVGAVWQFSGACVVVMCAIVAITVPAQIFGMRTSLRRSRDLALHGG
jgi:hypothetical protein